jgi:WD40 repeat protein
MAHPLSLSLRRELKGHQGHVKYVYMDDYKIVSGGVDGMIRVRHLGASSSADLLTYVRTYIPAQVWDCRGTSDSSLYTIAAHTRDIINMDVHEKAFASGSLDGSLKMWTVDT